MKTYVALLRGINVGGHNKLTMADLVHALEKHGLESYIQSGNIVFRHQDISRISIPSIVESEFSIQSEVVCFEQVDFLEIAKQNPYANLPGNKVHFYFCQSMPDINRSKLAELRAASEEVAEFGSVVYLYAPDGVGRSKLAAKMESCLGVPATSRNLNTVNKLLKLAENLN